MRISGTIRCSVARTALAANDVACDQAEYPQSSGRNLLSNNVGLTKTILGRPKPRAVASHMETSRARPVLTQPGLTTSRPGQGAILKWRSPVSTGPDDELSPPSMREDAPSRDAGSANFFGFARHLTSTWGTTLRTVVCVVVLVSVVVISLRVLPIEVDLGPIRITRLSSHQARRIGCGRGGGLGAPAGLPNSRRDTGDLPAPRPHTRGVCVGEVGGHRGTRRLRSRPCRRSFWRARLRG